jgi:hypothetical protein
MLVNTDVISVKPVQTVIGSYPDVANRILFNAVCKTTGKLIFIGYSGEA